MWVALSLSLGAVAYNNLVNRWGPFQGAAYVPLNLAFVGTLAILGARALGLSRAELGLGGDLGDAGLPVAVVTLFALVAFALAGSGQADRIADRRVAGRRGAALAFYVLVRIPLGTAVAEEALFRGLLLAAWRAAGASTLSAALCASIAFGLWHVTPTIIGMRMNDPRAGRRKLGVAVGAAVLFTVGAGMGLTWLRLHSGGLLGPIVLHAGINSVGALAAARAGSRSSGRGHAQRPHP